MDNASDYESGDCRFDPCQGREHFFMIQFFHTWYLEYWHVSRSIRFNVYEYVQPERVATHNQLRREKPTPFN